MTDAQGDRARQVHYQDRRLQRLPYPRVRPERRQGAREGLVEGDALGWRGDVGNMYPANLRQYMQGHSERSGVKTAKTEQFRPPMPCSRLHET